MNRTLGFKTLCEEVCEHQKHTYDTNGWLYTGTRHGNLRHYVLIQGFRVQKWLILNSWVHPEKKMQVKLVSVQEISNRTHWTDP